MSKWWRIPIVVFCVAFPIAMVQLGRAVGRQEAVGLLIQVKAPTLDEWKRSAETGAGVHDAAAVPLTGYTALGVVDTIGRYQHPNVEGDWGVVRLDRTGAVIARCLPSEATR